MDTCLQFDMTMVRQMIHGDSLASIPNAETPTWLENVAIWWVETREDRERTVTGRGHPILSESTSPRCGDRFPASVYFW